MVHTTSFTSPGAPPIVNASVAMVVSYGATNDQLIVPRGVCFDSTAFELYASDQNRHRVQIFSVNLVAGQGVELSPSNTVAAPSARGASTKPPLVFSHSFGSKGHVGGQLHYPTGLDVSHYHILVCDTGNTRISVFTKRGGFVCTFGSKGSREGQFIDPRDIKLANIRKVRNITWLAFRSSTY